MKLEELLKNPPKCIRVTSDTGFFEYKNNFETYNHIPSICVFDNTEDLKPLVSIMIPTFRRPHLLKEAVQSALNQQTSIPFEVVVVDNEPSDTEIMENTEHVLRAFKSKRLRYFRNMQNIGMFGNWNRCIELANGYSLTILNDDDLLLPEFVEKVHNTFQTLCPDSFLVCSFSRFGAKISSSKLQSVQQTRKKLERIPLFRLQFGNIFPGTLGAFATRQNWIQTGGFNEDYYPSSDYIFWMNQASARRYWRLNDTLAEYRVEENESLRMETRMAFVLVEWFWRRSALNTLTSIKVLASSLQKLNTKFADIQLLYLSNQQRPLGEIFPARIFVAVAGRFLRVILGLLCVLSFWKLRRRKSSLFAFFPGLDCANPVTGGEKLNCEIVSAVIDHGGTAFCNSPPKYFSSKALQRLWSNFELLRAVFLYRPNFVITDVYYHSFGIAGFMLARIFGTEVVSVLHHLTHPLRTNLLLRSAERFTEEFLLRISSRVFTISKSEMAAARKCGAKDVRRILPTVTLKHHDVPEEVSLEEKVGNLKLLFIGSIVERKGVNFLLSALENLDENIATLTIVGSLEETSDYAQAVRKQAESPRLKSRVSMLGRCTDEELRSLFLAHDVFVLPSLYEGFGLVALEAGLLGLPVIASAVGGLKEVVSHGETGILVEAADTQALSEAIRELALNPMLRLQMGRTARRHAKRLVSDVSFGQQVVSSLVVDPSSA